MNFPIWLVLAVLSLAIVTAETNCQYVVNESYSEFGDVYYKGGSPLNSAPSISETNILASKDQVQFRVYNPWNYTVEVVIEYDGLSSWYGNSHHVVRSIVISNEFEDIDSVLLNTRRVGNVQLEITSPGSIIKKQERIEKTREVCKQCLGIDCLNDGESCNSLLDNHKCGSEKCNIAGVCGTEKVVDCPDGTTNCNDQQCLKPSTKDVGEAYSCSFQCKSDRYENGICLKSTEQEANETAQKNKRLQDESDARKLKLIIFSVLSVLIVVIATAYFAVWKRKTEEARLQEAKRQLKDINIVLDRLTGEIVQLNQDIKRIKTEKIRAHDNIRSLKNKIKKLHGRAAAAKGDAKASFEKQIVKLEKESDTYKTKKQNAEKREVEYLNAISAAEKAKAKALKEGQDAYVITQTEKYRRKYEGRSSKVYYDSPSKNIKIRFNDGNEYFLHRHIYYNKIGLNKGDEVHHIDKDHLNNELWNLIAISKKMHKDFVHSRFDKGDWPSGMRELKKQIHIKEKDLPKHIRNHVANISK